MNKRLSVIIPGYNTPEAWWTRCVDSVLKAVGPTDEVILVDDGGTRGVEGLERLERLDDRVRVIHKKNGGLGDARNAGMAVAQGEYVTFVDSDDEILPETYEKCLRQIEATVSDIAIYGVKTVWTKEGLCKRDVPDSRDYGRLKPEDVQDLSRRCLLNYAWNKVYRKAFLDQNQLQFDVDGMPCEDIIFNLDCICKGARWCSVDYVGYVYYRVSGGRTILTSYKPTNNRGLLLGAEAWRRYCDTLMQTEATPFLPRATLGEKGLLALEWKNIWMPGTPYSLLGRWQWLRMHSELGGVGKYVKTLLFVFFRRHFYVRSLRRWNIRRLYPYAVNSDGR